MLYPRWNNTNEAFPYHARIVTGQSNATFAIFKQTLGLSTEIEMHRVGRGLLSQIKFWRHFLILKWERSDELVVEKCLQPKCLCKLQKCYQNLCGLWQWGHWWKFILAWSPRQWPLRVPWWIFSQVTHTRSESLRERSLMCLIPIDKTGMPQMHLQLSPLKGTDISFASFL